MLRTAFVVLAAVGLMSGCKSEKAESTKTETRKVEGVKVEGTRMEGAQVEPDNTRVNVRDRNEDSETPMDQSNSAPDLKITQEIRQAVSNAKALSFTAKNVKIITRDAQVTLKGPVKTAEEKNTIDALARSVAGVGKVDNQLEVEANK
jgi:hyperosmotically inducible protein